MLEFSKQKQNIREVINDSLDFLLHRNEIPKGRVEYAGFSCHGYKINYTTFSSKKLFLNYDFWTEIDVADKYEILELKKEETKHFIIIKFLETLNDGVITAETLAEKLNDHFIYNELDFQVTGDYLKCFLEKNIIKPTNRKYKLEVSEQFIKNAYCNYITDMLNFGQFDDDYGNLEYLKNFDDTLSVKENIISLNNQDYLRAYNLEPYLFNEIKENFEVKYIYHFIKSTFKKLESFTKIKAFNNLDFIKSSYDKSNEYTITEQDVNLLYFYHNKDINDLYAFLINEYEVIEFDKEINEKRVVAKIIPLFKMNDKVFLQKIIKELKKKY